MNYFAKRVQIIPLDSFESQSADGRYVPIVPGGQCIQLTFHNRREYVERALYYRLHEFDQQVHALFENIIVESVVTCETRNVASMKCCCLTDQIAAIREGMSWIVPVPLLSLLTPHHLEELVCGAQEISIAVLKKLVRYVTTLRIHRDDSFANKSSSG